MDNISREVAEREIVLAESAAPKSPVERDIEYGSTVAAMAKRITELEAMVEWRNIKIADARQAFEEINKRAAVLAHTLHDLKNML